MSEPYLIAHLVRGEPAFDIAERMPCPECGGLDALYKIMYNKDCAECESSGFWWIIPTSGHRAYPYWNVALTNLGVGAFDEDISEACPPAPSGWPDHYPINQSPAEAKANASSLLATLGLAPKPANQVRRRL